MIGLFLALIFGLMLVGFGRRWQDAYCKATTLLFWWNLAITMFLGCVWYFGIALAAGLGWFFSGAVGFLVGLTGGGIALSILLFFMIVASVFQIIGSVMMYNAVEIGSDGTYRWNEGVLVAGIIFFLLGLVRIFG